MSSPTPIDWRSTLLGFAAACTALAVLALIAPLEDKLLLAGAAGATAVLMFGLSAWAKPLATTTH